MSTDSKLAELINRRDAERSSSSLFLLFLVFLVLKLTGVIAWSWVWVTAPLWGPAGLMIGFLFGTALIIWVTLLVKKLFRRS